eukprot:scaffold13751_cov108-Isochrysis_galbana.AAC.7
MAAPVPPSSFSCLHPSPILARSTTSWSEDMHEPSLRATKARSFCSRTVRIQPATPTSRPTPALPALKILTTERRCEKASLARGSPAPSAPPPALLPPPALAASFTPPAHEKSVWPSGTPTTAGEASEPTPVPACLLAGVVELPLSISSIVLSRCFTR